jgi:hypothetical protein
MAGRSEAKSQSWSGRVRLRAATAGWGHDRARPEEASVGDMTVRQWHMVVRGGGARLCSRERKFSQFVV